MKSVSIIIPVYNELSTLPLILKKVDRAKTLGLKKEIIIVDDGSTDGSTKFLKKLSNKYIVIHLSKNSGKGFALRTAFKACSGDIILIQDADLEYSPDDYPELLRPITSGLADVVYGSRLVTSRPHRVLLFWHYVANVLLTTLSNMFSNLNLSDMETGYKVLTRGVLNQILPKLRSNRFGFEPELTALLGKLARTSPCRIYEVGVSYAGRTYAEGKKIGIKDAFQACLVIIRTSIWD